MEEDRKVLFSREDTIRLHREMWGWLVENPGMNKVDWPGWNSIDKYEVDHQCFACQYVVDRYMGSGWQYKNCRLWCPFKWPGRDCLDHSRLGDFKGIYARWEPAMEEEEYSKTTALAAQIRDLPVRDPYVELAFWSTCTDELDPRYPPEAYPLRLQGVVYGHPDFPAGANIVTSTVISFEGRVIKTRNTTYHLGGIDPKFRRWLKKNRPNWNWKEPITRRVPNDQDRGSKG